MDFASDFVLLFTGLALGVLFMLHVRTHQRLGELRTELHKQWAELKYLTEHLGHLRDDHYRKGGEIDETLATVHKRLTQLETKNPGRR